MRTGGGTGHSRNADHLTAADVLALGHVYAREVPMEGKQAVARVDLDRHPAQAFVAVRVEPVRVHDGARGGSGDRLVRQPIVITVVAVVVEVVGAPRRPRIALAEARVGTADLARSLHSLVSAPTPVHTEVEDAEVAQGGYA